MRKLASIKKIKEIKPAENADALELAYVDGWQVVVRKGDFQPGDLAVYFEIDSIVPDLPCFEFMRQRKFKVKTAKIRGNLSQGLLMPIEFFDLGPTNPVEGADVTEVLGVQKYEPPNNFDQGDSIGHFPFDLLPITDETRIQSCAECLDEFRGKPYYATVKLNGTSFTALMKDGEFCACSRKMIKALDEGNVYGKIAAKYDLATKMARIPRFAIRGEICGPSIQKNMLGLSELRLFIFDIWDLAHRRNVNFVELVEFTRQLEIPLVPIEMVKDHFDFTVEELLTMADGKYDDTDNWREGLVFRPQMECFSETLAGRLSFKAISNKYLLKGGSS